MTAADSSNVSPFPDWLKQPEKDKIIMAPSGNDRQNDSHMQKTLIVVLQILVSCVITVVGVGSVPFAMRVENRLATIEQNLVDGNRDRIKIDRLEEKVLALELKLAARP